MKINIVEKVNELKDRWSILNQMLEKLKEDIILNDLSKALNIKINSGRQLVTTHDGIDEINVDGESLTLINKELLKYCCYVVVTKKNYHTLGLGFLYKGTLLSPHIDNPQNIINKYTNKELNEIVEIINHNIVDINNDIEYIKVNSNVETHEHYYGEYNKGFDSHYHYETIYDVINDYKSNVEN